MFYGIMNRIWGVFSLLPMVVPCILSFIHMCVNRLFRATLVTNLWEMFSRIWGKLYFQKRCAVQRLTDSPKEDEPTLGQGDRVKLSVIVGQSGVERFKDELLRGSEKRVKKELVQISLDQLH